MIHSTTSDISMMTPPPFQWRLSSGILIQPGNASHGHRLTSRSRQVTHPMLFLQVPSIYLSIHPFLDDLFWLLSTHEYHGFGARCLSSRFRWRMKGWSCHLSTTTVQVGVIVVWKLTPFLCTSWPQKKISPKEYPETKNTELRKKRQRHVSAQKRKWQKQWCEL